ncbi:MULTISPECIES: hydroxyacid dehydrogenase [Clostridium]|uniref:hydroxyacid dehydrogenase n=1 Tax=Clostridium TaxID=1485 RepID=UPI0008245026|nr:MULTISPECIES: hydroxyacid dehydrogenase [Clostridium]PJI08687.1 3-phosphoglycerate dehydrogenase [Clostridium sp. CT7]
MGYKVLITEDIEQEGKDYLKKAGYEIKLADSIDEDNLVREVNDYDAILTRVAIISERVLKAAKKLKVIGKFGVGVDTIDVEAATRLGIQVTNSAEANKNTVAEYTMGLVLALAKNLILYDSELRDGNFGIRTTFGMDVQDKVLGIVGAGAIGKLVAKKASLGFGMKVIEYRRHIEKLKSEKNAQVTNDLDYLLKNSDFVSLHVPLTQNTRHMIGKRELSLMKKSAFLINTARGEVVDDDALVHALSNGEIKGAAVDVYAGEVPAKDNPLFKLKNVIVSPHTAAHTREAMVRMSICPAIGIDEVLRGKKPSWPVNHIV